MLRAMSVAGRSRRLFLHGVALGVLAAALGCAGKVKHEAAPGYDFKSLKTYAWITEDLVLIQLGETQANVRTEENERHVRGAIDDALAARGLTAAPHDTADVLVAFSVGTHARYRLEGGENSWIAGLEPGKPQTKGTLHIYLVHRGDEKELWHGWTSKWLNEGDDPEQVIGDAVTRIMATFPVAAR